jgi:hypothetical protein
MLLIHSERCLTSTKAIKPGFVELIVVSALFYAGRTSSAAAHEQQQQYQWCVPGLIRNSVGHDS